jgi:hypothetical protein
LLLKAGFSEQEAREFTLTSELFMPSFKGLADLARGEPKFLVSMLFPFVKTPLNIAEQGLTRTPITGFWSQAIREKHGAPKIDKLTQGVQQAIGGVMGLAGYALGANVSPEQANHVRRWAANAAGPYSALVSVGFAAGLASQKGKRGITPIAQEIERTLPLPTTQTLTDLYRFADKASQGQIEAKDLPRGMVPAILREAAPSEPKPIPGMSNFSSIRIKGLPK